VDDLDSVDDDFAAEEEVSDIQHTSVGRKRGNSTVPQPTDRQTSPVNRIPKKRRLLSLHTLQCHSPSPRTPCNSPPRSASVRTGWDSPRSESVVPISVSLGCHSRSISPYPFESEPHRSVSPVRSDSITMQVCFS